jgi:hypothetical protein
MRLKRFVTAFVALLALILLVGYGTAFARVPACKTLFAQDLQSHRVRGIEFGGGEVLPTSSQVESRILLPFSVELSLSLPRDLHQATYFATCVALPWRVDLLFRSEVVPI